MKQYPRRAAYAGLGVVGAMILSSCSAPDLMDTSIPLQDGVFSGSSNPDEQGAVGTATITVTAGKITDTTFETVDKSGQVKGPDYGKTRGGDVANQDYYDRAQHAVEAYAQYAEELTEKQDPTAVDKISGASVAYSQFLQAALRAIYQSQGVEDDGRTDTINMPGLGLSDDDY